jgi:hypothetical protein
MCELLSLPWDDSPEPLLLRLQVTVSGLPCPPVADPSLVPVDSDDRAVDVVVCTAPPRFVGTPAVVQVSAVGLTGVYGGEILPGLLLSRMPNTPRCVEHLPRLVGAGSALWRQPAPPPPPPPAQPTAPSLTAARSSCCPALRDFLSSLILPAPCLPHSLRPTLPCFLCTRSAPP